MKTFLIYLLILWTALPCVANNKMLLPKDSQELPDNYGLTVVYITGKSDVLELASHSFDKALGIMEVWTKDDKCLWLPITNIQKMEFDKRFSKMVAEHAENEIKNDIKAIYSKVNDLAISTAVLSTIVPRIEETLKTVPCQRHTDEIELCKKELYATKRVWAAIYGITFLTASLLTFFSRIFRWF